jgi:hypothetical protein
LTISFKEIEYRVIRSSELYAVSKELPEDIFFKEKEWIKEEAKEKANSTIESKINIKKNYK